MKSNTLQAAESTLEDRQAGTRPETAQHETRKAGTARVAAARTAVVVLGMHRSGTSVMTRVVSLLGADLPSNVMPSMAGINESGFWESLDTYVLNESILATLGSRWDDWRRLDSDRMLSAASDLKARALKILEQNFASSGLFVLKDPRMCRLLPFWLESLQRFGAETKCVLPLRDPIEVAASLGERDGFVPAKSYLLWLRHVLDAELASRGLPRAFLAYDDLLDDWRAAVARIAERLGVSWSRHSEAEELEIDRFLSAHLRHHVTDEASLQRHPEIAGWVKDTFKLLNALVRDPASQEPQRGLDGIRREFDRASDALGALLRAEEATLEEARQRLGMYDAEAGAANAQIRKQGVRVEESKPAAAMRDSDPKALETTVRWQDAHSDELARQAAAQNHRITELTAAIAERDDRIGELQLSLHELQTATVELERRVSAYRDEGAVLDEQRNRLLHRLNSIQACRIWRLGRLRVSLGQQPRRHCRDKRALPPRVCFGRTLQMKDRRCLRQQANRLFDAGLFDVYWYVENYPDVVLEGGEPVWHWLVTGCHEGLNPNPLFDTGWYKKRNPDVSAAKINPLLHYLDYGAAEGRDPGPMFDSDWYLAKYADVGNAGINPLAHYLKYGRAEGRDPNPLFDHAWYTSQYPQVASLGVDALEHYLKRGVAEGCNPCPLFDTAWYLEKNADVARSGTIPLAHYLDRGAVERRLQPCALFDTAAYLAQYPDVAEAGINPLVHYVIYGATRGYDPNPLFDSDWYLKRYPDVAEAGVNPLAHYLVQGAADGRNPGPHFETAWYAANYRDVIPSGLNPLHHYLQYGRDEGRLARKPREPDTSPADRHAGSRTADFDPASAWPAGSMGLLVQAAYHNDPAVAAQSWGCWRDENPDLDTIDWQTARVIAHTATTLSSLGPESKDPATWKGMRQFDWTHLEHHLHNVRPLLDALTREGILIMVSKGAAFHLSGIVGGRSRLMTDLDILIDPSQIENVMVVAGDLGWKSKWPLSREGFKDCLSSSRHSLPLSNGERWEVDLHTSALLLNRCPDHDTPMWQRGTEARIGHVPVVVPGATDLLVVTLGHGLLYTRRPMGIWIGDAIALIESGAVDWDVFLDEIERRDLAVFAYTGLAYISRVLGRPVPGHVLEILAARLCEPFISEFSGHVISPHATSRTIRRSWGAAAIMRATKWLSRVNPQRDVSTAGIAVDSGWRDANRRSGKNFTVDIPGKLREAGAQCLLEIGINPDLIRSTDGLDVALTCFDYHACELDHWATPAESPADDASLNDGLIRFRIDTAIIPAYSLRKLGLELLAPGTLDASPVGADGVKYRWRL